MIRRLPGPSCRGMLHVESHYRRRLGFPPGGASIFCHDVSPSRCGQSLRILAPTSRSRLLGAVSERQPAISGSRCLDLCRHPGVDLRLNPTHRPAPKGYGLRECAISDAGVNCRATKADTGRDLVQAQDGWPACRCGFAHGSLLHTRKNSDRLFVALPAVYFSTPFS